MATRQEELDIRGIGKVPHRMSLKCSMKMLAARGDVRLFMANGSSNSPNKQQGVLWGELNEQGRRQAELFSLQHQVDDVQRKVTP